MSRYLITTADERTWKFDRPVLFLGEWCRRYDRKHVWQKMDAEVAEPYGLGKGQKERDLTYVYDLFNILLTELTDALNAYHKTDHSRRYWHIVLGHWLRCYLSVTFHRYHALEQTLKNYDVSGTISFDSSDFQLATSDSCNFLYACNDDGWNHVLCSKILTYLGGIKTEISDKPLQGVSGFSKEESAGNIQKGSIKSLVRKVAKSFLPCFSRNSDAFIVNSFLPRFHEALLQISLCQVPKIWQSPDIESSATDANLRQQFSIKAENYSGYEEFVRRYVNEFLPICFFEGYSRLLSQVKSVPWPNKPKFIFTSNNFAVDEVFKVWTGLKTETGVPYYIGQHGNLYGTEIERTQSPETEHCSKFITWGWTNGSDKNIPAFVFKIAGCKQRKPPSDGGLLLIEVHQPHRNAIWDNYYEHGLYQEEQFRFVESLPRKISEQLTVRFHGEYKNTNWSDEKRWGDRSPHTRLETGSVSIKKLISQSRLVVHSYDSTGILETLALNIPTLCFWQGGFDHLLSTAKPYYQLLRDAGIIANSPEEAAKLVAVYWDNVGEWWQSNIVQNARHTFCQQFARIEKYPIRVLKKLLTQNMS